MKYYCYANFLNKFHVRFSENKSSFLTKRSLPTPNWWKKLEKKKKRNILLVVEEDIKGIVSRDYGRLQMILTDRAWVTAVKLKVSLF